MIPGQRTIRTPFTFTGVGLHTGKTCRVTVSSLPPGSGIRIFRTDLDAEIIVSPEKVTSTARGTTLSGEKGSQVHTIEHFLAATRGVGVDNLKIEVDSEEMPIMDGSSALFCEMFRKAGIQDQGIPVSPIRVTEPIELSFGDIYLKAEPADGLYLDVTTSFPYPGLENQKRAFQL